MPYHHGLLNQPDPDPPWGRPRVPQSLLSAAEEWGRNPQRPMVSPQGASIGPPQSRMSRIWDHLRHGIPRRVEEFLEPETPAGLAGLLGASVMEPAGTAIDVADFAAGFRDRDLPRMGWAAGGAALPFVAGSTMRKVIGGGKLKEARSPRPEEIADAAEKGFQPYSVGLPASRADDGTIFTRRQPAEHGDLIKTFDGYEIDLPDGSFVEASFDGSGRGLNKDGWLVDDVFYSVDDVQRIVAPGETPRLLAKAADELPNKDIGIRVYSEEQPALLGTVVGVNTKGGPPIYEVEFDNGFTDYLSEDELVHHGPPRKTPKTPKQVRE